MLTFSVTFTFVCRPVVDALNNNSHASGKRLVSNLRCSVGANSIKIATGPHSMNAKSFLVLVRANGVRVSTRFWLSKIKRSGSLRKHFF